MKSFVRGAAFCACAFLTFASSSALAANMLSNGSFENGSNGFDNWTLGGSSGDPGFPPVVIAYNNVVARLRRLPRSPEEASADLGANAFTTFRRVTLPGMGTALLSGGLLAYALSFDEIIVTNFTAGAGTQTIPLWIFASIQRPSELPVVNVVAFLLILVSVIPVWLAQRISGAETAGARL